MSVHNEHLLKYPRTPHLQGSRLQAGDDGSDQTPYTDLQGQYIVIEEKMDGANAGFSFTEGGELRLQSRGHYLVGGGRESQFGLFKSWATAHQDAFLDRFEDRYLVFGEWMYAKHTVYYNQLPHLFLEFDIYDKAKGMFLSTQARRALCDGLPIASVPVLYEGVAPKHYRDVLGLIGRLTAKTATWEDDLVRAAVASGAEPTRVQQQTLMHDGMEGLYIKVETSTETTGRYKFVRRDFLQAILDGDGHHAQRMLVPNRLDPSVDIFASHNSWNKSPTP